MYRDFYGLQDKPFTKTPDPRFLYMSSGHREALARLHHAIEERELALLTGDIGCGKTTLSRALMDLAGDDYHFCFIFNPRLTGMELLKSIARSLKLDVVDGAKDDLLTAITTALYRFHEQQRCPVVVIDEAQLIEDREVFDEIRLLTNYQLDDRNLLSVIIMGQPELRDKLMAPELEPLRQRIAIQYHLQPLNLEETLEYLDFRVEVAGGPSGLFAPDAVVRIHDITGGVPRKINILASNALLVGYGKDSSWIDGDTVDELRHELV